MQASQAISVEQVVCTTQSQAECKRSAIDSERSKYKLTEQLEIHGPMKRYQLNKKVFVLLAALVLCFTLGCMWFITAPSDVPVLHEADRRFSKWPPYRNMPKNPPEWYYLSCFGFRDFTAFKITLLMTIWNGWQDSSRKECRLWLQRFNSIYSVSVETGYLYLPPKFHQKVLQWLGGSLELVEAAKAQDVVQVFNKLTNEQTLFNPIRAKRPSLQQKESPRNAVDLLVKNTQPDCDFCSYLTLTAADTFGRVESQFSFSTANAFKLDKWHAMFVPRWHHPLDLTQETLLDLFMNTALTWFEKVHSMDSRYRYPHMMWDVLPEGGASQVHPHVHGTITLGHYYGKVENIRQAAEKYHQLYPGRNYFTDLTELHQSLGLAVSYGNATAFAHLTPQKDNEIVIISREPCNDFFLMLHFVIRALVDDMQRVTFSMGMVLPPMGETGGPGEMPAFARIVSRGQGNAVSDISSFELFTVYNVNMDPGSVFEKIRLSVRKRGVPR